MNPDPADELDALLADLEERVQAIRDFRCRHQLERTATRKLARRMIALARHWRKEVAAVPATVSDTVANATASRVGSAGKQCNRLSIGATNASKSSGSDQVRARAPRAGR
jgi:hypothetical protein